jgi:glycosyltransferase involved in cell wall biosynthesis
MSGHHVTILLASYRGAAHIGQQLDSIAAQDHRDWSLIVSDDGSDDRTRDSVAEFAGRFAPGRVRLTQGPRQGATDNFLSLIARAQPDSALAFCDQDDVWFTDKLSRGMAAVTATDRPAHYAARTTITDAQLRPLRGSRHFPRPLGLRNALVQACMAGNTSVFNAPAAAILRRAAPHARMAGVVAHDWWAYQVMAAMDARLIHDPRPALFYRQHGRSEVGRNDTLPALVLRLRKLMQGQFGIWMRANLASLEPLYPEMSALNRQICQDARRMLDLPGPLAARRLMATGFYRQTRMGTLALILSAAAGRLAVSRPPEA